MSITPSSRFVLPLLVFSLVAGCAASLSPEAERIAEVRAQEVSGCDLVARITGTAEGVFLSETALRQRAQSAALEKAVEAKATHVVWTNLEDERSSYVSGDAYRCR